MSPPLDLAALDRLHVAGGADLVKKMVALFLQNTPVRLEALRRDLESRDWAEVERTAHSMKSSAAYLGASDLRGHAERAEALARDGRGPEVRFLLSGLEQAFLFVRPALARILLNRHVS